jgi:hypothetical protein
MFKPNLQLPLASSFNERGMAGFTNTVTNRIDQQKRNCIYEVSKNAITGQGKLDLTKRPGVTVSGSSFGVSTQAAYAISTGFGVGETLLYSVKTPVVVANNSVTEVTIYSASSAEVWIPVFVDTTLISNVPTKVVQLNQFGLSVAQDRVFFCTNSIGAGFTQITDVDFVSLGTGIISRGKMEHMDGFAFQMLSNNTIINSDLNSLANWTSTNFIGKQIVSDTAVGLAKYKNQILGFAENSVEAYYNAGNATGSPLSPIKQLADRVGMIRTSLSGGSHYYCIHDNKLYFIGRQAGGSLSGANTSVGLFVYDGSTYRKISPSYIDKILGEQVGTVKYFSINTIGFMGHSGIGISFSASTSATQTWLMYFPEWNDWFEWNSTIFSPINSGSAFLGVTPNQHKIYFFGATDNWQDAGTSFTASTQFKLPQDGHQIKRMAEFGVLADTARSSNQLLVEFSDDDYQSFYTVGNIELQRDIKTLNRGGSYRQRAVRLSSTNALETRISAFVARIE